MDGGSYNGSSGTIAGAQGDQNTFTLDGLDISDSQVGGECCGNFGAGLPLPVEAIEEFNSSVTNQNANFGRSVGGNFSFAVRTEGPSIMEPVIGTTWTTIWWRIIGSRITSENQKPSFSTTEPGTAWAPVTRAIPEGQALFLPEYGATPLSQQRRSQRVGSDELASPGYPRIPGRYRKYHFLQSRNFNSLRPNE